MPPDLRVWGRPPSRSPTPPRHPWVGGEHRERLVRALQDQGRRGDPDHVARGAPGRARRRRVEHLPAAFRPGHDRPADRLGHERDERPAVGRDHDGRRGVRGLAELLPARGDGPSVLRVRARDPHAPGARGRAHHQRDVDRARGHDPGQHVLHDHPAASGARRGHVRRRDRRGRARPGRPVSVQGRRGPRDAREGDRASRARAVPVDRRHGEHGRRPADLDGQPPGDPRARGPTRDDRDVRRDPGGRERVLHPGARARLRRPERRRDPPRDVRPHRRLHDVGEEGLRS